MWQMPHTTCIFRAPKTMFSEVRHAILPLALRKIKRRGDLERAGLLIESLAKHWRDTKPFQLLIVSPGSDTHLLRTSLPRFSSFYMMTGWYRQQIVKLQVPVVLGFGGYLTLDSDVCCVGDFDATTFVEDGRGLSRWEPKLHHDWWRNAAKVVGSGYDGKGHGLSVTPNLLHGKLAAQTLEHVGNGAQDAT